MSPAGKHRQLHLLVSAVNFGWGIWALIGGTFFLSKGHEPIWKTVDESVHGFSVAGMTLVLCGVISIIASMCQLMILKKCAALICGTWCFGVAVLLQIATPGFDQSDVDAWLLLMCAFTCVMRWGLLVLEPHLDD